MRVEWHPLAHADLTELVTYIAEDSPDAAYRILDEVRRQTGMLASHADIGRLGRVGGTRELVITGTPYIAAYRVSRNLVTILRLLHGARRWPAAL
ncbi:MAG: type II toxin-antitoxin system RelE/ParE family toxin [Candidatus Acidoferrales bacterium]|nr:type II toxin-antitoxin system RelE/ParE family toxin [Candidatus Acidoferrales bacterium]